MSLGPHRWLGFAFANADLLLEVGADARVTFAVGASEIVSGAAEGELTGRTWGELVDPADLPMLEAMLEGLEDGRRVGPLVLRLAATSDGATRAAAIRAFRLPGAGGAISCALTRAALDKAPPKGALHGRAEFEELAQALLKAAASGEAELELAMLDIAGLKAARDVASPFGRAALERRLAGALRSEAYGGAAATALGDERFALVRARGEAVSALAARVTRLVNAVTPTPVAATAEAVALKPDGDRQALRALRYCLDSFLRDGPGSAPTNLSTALTEAMEKTLDEVGALGLAIREKDFRLVYQPVITLRTGGLHHYEALVRFGDEGSPFPLIRMAEEMDLIEALDLAILERAIEALCRRPGLKVAVNVSGRTIASAGFIERASNLIAAHPKANGRLMFELTESAALDDLKLAARHLEALRALGCEICLDDFGAGAASLAYLQQLRLDVLKIDGRYIRDLQRGGREATFVKHLVSMCQELNVRTLAEMVESREAEAAVREAGVDFAQGWLYGAAMDEPDWEPSRARAIS
ncbi:EAL domain-containing protein [Phenylobacterium sp.]|jgi:EAL domain-containing protein (putative c-di-GMP-specific phosphodiesterase class I)|uniref:EAL domain-containing protein n=1 Tax=Phenylobacterium sp. TaxID=1871053 RepID=UPI003784F20A